MTDATKYAIADAIAAALKPELEGFKDEEKSVQYALLFNSEVNDSTIVDLYPGDDGLHIVGLVRRRLIGSTAAKVTVELPV